MDFFGYYFISSIIIFKVQFFTSLGIILFLRSLYSKFSSFFDHVRSVQFSSVQAHSKFSTRTAPSLTRTGVCKPSRLITITACLLRWIQSRPVRRLKRPIDRPHLQWVRETGTPASKKGMDFEQEFEVEVDLKGLSTAAQSAVKLVGTYTCIHAQAQAHTVRPALRIKERTCRTTGTWDKRKGRRCNAERTFYVVGVGSAIQFACRVLNTLNSRQVVWVD